MKLHDIVEGYIDYKHSLGMRFRSQAAVLRAFNRAMGDIAIAKVKPESVLAFIAGTGPITARWIENHRVLGGFYRYAVGRGFATLSPLPTDTPRPPTQLTPYIYTVDELKRLLGGHRNSANTPFAAAGLNNAHAVSASLRHGHAHWRGPISHFTGCRLGEPRADGA